MADIYSNQYQQSNSTCKKDGRHKGMGI